MSSRIDLRAIHTQITCVQAECALWQIRRRMERVMATTTDEAQRLRIAEILREGRCPPDRVIRGAHGYFAGCLGGEGQPNTAFHQRDVTKLGGMKHEVEARYQRAMMKAASEKGDTAKAKAAEDKAKAADDKAAKGAAKLTANQRQELQDLADRLDAENRRLAERLANVDPRSKEGKALTKELGTRVTEAQLIYAHLGKAKEVTQEAESKPAKAPSGRKTATTPKASGRTSGAKGEAASKKPSIMEQIKDDDLTPVRQGINYTFNPTVPPSPRFLRTLYGDEQLRAALGRYNATRLKEMAAHYRIDAPPKRSKETAKAYRERLLDTIEKWAKSQPLLPPYDKQG